MHYSCSLLSSLVTLFLIIVLVPSSVLILASDLPVDNEHEFAYNVLLCHILYILPSLAVTYYTWYSKDITEYFCTLP